MMLKINSDWRESRGAPRRGASGLSRVLLLIAMLVATACTPASSEPEATALPLASSEPTATGDSVIDDPVIGDSAGGGRNLVDSEELIGLGELGLLPSLLQTFGARIDCDFDDAFSTCQ